MDLYLEGLIIGRIFASEVWGAYFRKGFFIYLFIYLFILFYFIFFWWGGGGGGTQQRIWLYKVPNCHYLKRKNFKHAMIIITDLPDKFFRIQKCRESYLAKKAKEFDIYLAPKRLPLKGERGARGVLSRVHEA